MWKRSKSTQTQHTLISDPFGVEGKVEGVGKVGLELSENETYDYITIDWIWFLLPYNILVIYYYSA